ncbi:MAG: U32 family peptidase [Betaproteobacteria bacterium]|nr:U32 family peptidase [Betaproteobacteria bacterium]
MDLVCPAGSLPALKTAVDNGADAVYIGFRDDTNARNFAGLNFDAASAREGIRYAHSRKRQVFVALNTFPHPQLRLHLSVQGSATNYEAINFFHQHFHIRRAVLPRVLSLAQVKQVIAGTPAEIEVFGFGSLCVMVEGRCVLSSYATGESPNTVGVCSPAKAVRWQPTPAGLESRLNGILIDRYAADENAAYPTLCKGRYSVDGATYYAIEEPASLNTLELIPELLAAGVAAIKIEGRQRSPAYVAQVTRTWREAIDACRANPARYAVRPAWNDALRKVSEGQQQTLGAYHRPWK